eukprot:scaffold3829_cov45-Cyclotella_meneghiniana.AAC.2
MVTKSLYYLTLIHVKTLTRYEGFYPEMTVLLQAELSEKAPHLRYKEMISGFHRDGHVPTEVAACLEVFFDEI